MVYDLDSTLSFPCTLREYWTKAIRTDIMLNKKFHVTQCIWASAVHECTDTSLTQSQTNAFLRTDSNYIVKFHERCFRVIKANEFLKNFSSDRRHMRNDHGDFIQPPPRWSPIFDKSIFLRTGHNLDDFISMDHGILSDISTVYDEETFQQVFVDDTL
ncbi:unnamed protein product [Anisakis simplex]|uniref:Protein N-terminal glutamine amidohydrolase n=1 Tax=Anisakis simplex TaxID=6269 RepID=A0A0M3K4T4_ANISI|nr:unnamed protein product [Anisakis simplex]